MYACALQYSDTYIVNYIIDIVMILKSYRPVPAPVTYTLQTFKV